MHIYGLGIYKTVYIYGIVWVLLLCEYMYLCVDVCFVMAPLFYPPNIIEYLLHLGTLLGTQDIKSESVQTLLLRMSYYSEEARFINLCVQFKDGVGKYFIEGLKKRMFQIFTSAFHLSHAGLSSFFLVLFIIQVMNLQLIFYFNKTSKMVVSVGGKVLIYASKSCKTFCFSQHHIKICCLNFGENYSLLNFFPFITL